MKILIIDDDARIRELIRMWLEREKKFEIFEAENGRQGVHIQKTTPVDMVICDLIMPIQEGSETIAQFSAEFPGVGIIAISGGGKIGPDSYLAVAEQLGAWKVFTKPLDMPGLMRAINRWPTKNISKETPPFGRK